MFDQPTIDVYREQVLKEFSPLSPRLRMQVVLYLVEAKYDNVVELAREIVDYIAETNEDFLTALDAVLGEDDDAEIVVLDQPVQGDGRGAGYL